MSTSPTSSPQHSPSNPSTTTTTTSDPSASSFTLDNPTDSSALSSYARTMHAHTLSQLSQLDPAKSNPRRTPAPSSAKRGGDAQPVSAIGVLREESSAGSVDSVAS